MIVQQTTILIFQYPQDYMQEQEWCKTKGDRWIHKGTDTLGAVYENTISYSIGQPNSSEIPNNCETQTERPSCESCKWDSEEWYDRHCDSCVAHTDKPSNYEPKDEPQTDCAWRYGDADTEASDH